MQYSDLSTEQREMAAYLFADELFGTDPAAFDYEIDDARGDLTGRVPMASCRSDNHKPRELQVEMISQVDPFSQPASDELHSTLARVAIREITRELAHVMAA